MALVAENEGLITEARRLRNEARLEEAERVCREALALNANDAELHRVLATILHEAGRYEDALASFDEALRIDPSSAKAYKQLATVLADHGRVAEAMSAARSALECRPDYVAVLSIIASLKTFASADDDDLATMEALVQQGERMETSDLMLLHFALGKAYEDLGDFDRAFEQFRAANALKRLTLDHDVESEERLLERVASVFESSLFDRLAGVGSPSEVPVLIVGMPRSGTTLIEQILDSHPAVRGGGERRDLREIVSAISALSGGVGFPEGVPDVTPDHLRALGEGYARRLHSLAPEAARVTDKAPGNFVFLGLVRLCLPQARIIHCMRDPRDTCVSLFGRNSSDALFSFGLRELGRYYRAYERLMEHWREVLPEGWILEVRYEELVEDFEGGVQRIVEYCGLPWDPACLSFHRNRRVVRTQSFMQVRRPLYRSSVGRWRRYEAHLQPLLETLQLEAT